MTTEEQYKNFIKNCTTSPKSVNNYSDFKRINETIAKIKGVDSFDILVYIPKNYKISLIHLTIMKNSSSMRKLAVTSILTP